jgi:hypothetical protein
MESAQQLAFGNADIPLIAAVFLNETSAGDAIADLNLAGFSASDVGVAVSTEDMKGRPTNRNPDQAPDTLQQEHSIFWKIRHANAHDLDRMGPGLSSRKDEQASRQPEYTAINLIDTLRARGIPEDTVHLLCREVGATGILIVVRALERYDKVESILVLNGGHLRTAMATEHARTHP